MTLKMPLTPMSQRASFDPRAGGNKWDERTSERTYDTVYATQPMPHEQLSIPELVVSCNKWDGRTYDTVDATHAHVPGASFDPRAGGNKWDGRTYDTVYRMPLTPCPMSIF
jgi:hypothetical protein